MKFHTYYPRKPHHYQKIRRKRKLNSKQIKYTQTHTETNHVGSNIKKKKKKWRRVDRTQERNRRKRVISEIKTKLQELKALYFPISNWLQSYSN